jgi:hypothetical protein
MQNTLALALVPVFFFVLKSSSSLLSDEELSLSLLPSPSMEKRHMVKGRGFFHLVWSFSSVSCFVLSWGE